MVQTYDGDSKSNNEARWGSLKLDMSIYKSYSVQDTIDIAKKIAQTAIPGDIFLLNGDMGCGKTVFAKGFALGLMIDSLVTSPTFTLLNVYHGYLDLYHFDLYRCQGQIEELGFHEYFFGKGVCLIEWGCYAVDTLHRYNEINIKTDNTIGSDYRLIEAITNTVSS